MVPLSTIHRLATLDGLSVMPVGLEPAPVIVQLPTSDPDTVYLKTLSVVASLTTQRFVPSVTMSLGLELPLLRLKLLAAFWLPERRLAAPVSPLRWPHHGDLRILVDEPDVYVAADDIQTLAGLDAAPHPEITPGVTWAKHPGDDLVVFYTLEDALAVLE